MQEDLGAEDVLSGLSSSQRAAVTSESAPLCVLASAGAGKTRVLTRRIAYRSWRRTGDPTHTVAVTFTRKAAGELQHRLRQLGLREQVAAGTFHSLASAQLHRWWSDRGQQPPVLLERKARLVAPLAGGRRGLAHASVADLAGHLEWARACLVGPEQFETAVRTTGRSLPAGVAPADLAGLYSRYEHEKRRRGLIDFDDLLSLCTDALERDPEFAGAQRWRWRHVYVDEFQDLNPLQHRLLLAWLGPSRDLFVVGDPHQAIYGWNGADPDLLAQVPSRWPSTEVIHLDANHRCTRQIVAAAASVLGPAGGHLRSAGRDGPEPGIRAYPSEIAEARGIAAEVRVRHEEGRPWGSMAVLTRTNAQLVPIQRALGAAGIPFWAPAQAALLDDPAIRTVLQEMRRDPGRPLQAAVADLTAQADGDSDEGGAAAKNAGDDAGRGAVTVLADMARSFAEQEPGSTVGRWLAWLPSALRDASDGATRSGAVTLCTFHRAKGLEWDGVWVAGLELGLVPIGRAGSAPAEAEEQRLLYVALTRAATELRCSWARQRTFGSRPVPREPSPWLDRIAGSGRSGTSLSPAGPGWKAPRAWRDRIDEQRRELRDRSRSARRPIRSRLPQGWAEPDPDLVRSLRAWRLDTARTSGVPAYVVLHDVTLEALAVLRPTTVEQLLAVPGLGPVKAARYGPSLLSLVARPAASA
jgi:DNA helicase II / ATP-dependent DNA helicase PcrA